MFEVFTNHFDLLAEVKAPATIREDRRSFRMLQLEAQALRELEQESLGRVGSSARLR